MNNQGAMGMNQGNNAMNQGMNQGSNMGGGPMRNARPNDSRQQNRSAPYQKNLRNDQQGGQRGGGNFNRQGPPRAQGNFQRQGSNSNGFDNSMQMDNRQPMNNNFDRQMGGNNNFDRRSGNNNFDDNNFGFSEDRRGFALPSFPNDMSQSFGSGNNNRMGDDRRGGQGNNLIYW